MDIQEVRERYEAIILEHLQITSLAPGGRGWWYKQELMRSFEFLGSFWRSVGALVRVFVGGEVEYKSAEELEMAEVTLAVPVWWSWFGRYDAEAEFWLHRLLSRIRQAGEVMVTAFDARRMNALCVKWVLGQKKVTRVRYLSNSVVGFTFAPQDVPATSEPRAGDLYRVAYADYPGPGPVAYNVIFKSDKGIDLILLNSRSPFAQWYLRASTFMREGCFGVDERRFERLSYLLAQSVVFTSPDSMTSLNDNLVGLHQMQGLPAELRPPEVALSRANFEIKRRKPSAHLRRHRHPHG